jgi:hypothetical protein
MQRPSDLVPFAHLLGFDDPPVEVPPLRLARAPRTAQYWPPPARNPFEYLIARRVESGNASAARTAGGNFTKRHATGPKRSSMRAE